MDALPIHGRGTAENPRSRFETLCVEPSAPVRGTGANGREDGLRAPTGPETRYLRDRSRSVLTRNDSPDVGFDVSLNPYRGCEHGCVYCYARPTHEYLGFSAGLDFESRILVKENAADLLRSELAAPSWRPRTIAMSGVTDPYQPVERSLEITRGCLEVLAEARQPVSIVTKSRLVLRDRDLLTELADHGAVRVTLSVTTLDEDLRRSLEPRAPTPEARLDAIEKLAAAGIPVGVFVAPVVPGLTEHELPSILEAAAERGARHAGYVLLRLPHGVSELFEAWLERHASDRKEKVLNRIRSMRGGRLNDARFGTRMKGEGEWARQIERLHFVTCDRLKLNRDTSELSSASFHAPRSGPQRELFGTD
jgi:DNA repair photolyase